MRPSRVTCLGHCCQKAQKKATTYRLKLKLGTSFKCCSILKQHRSYENTLMKNWLDCDAVIICVVTIKYQRGTTGKASSSAQKCKMRCFTIQHLTLFSVASWWLRLQPVSRWRRQPCCWS